MSDKSAIDQKRCNRCETDDFRVRFINVGQTLQINLQCIYCDRIQKFSIMRDLMTL